MLRDTIEAAVNTVTNAPVTPETEAPVEKTPVETAAPEAPQVETAEQKAGRTSGRARDEQGRLLPGKSEVKPEPKAEAAPQRPPRPSSWKKEMWEHYDKLDPKVAEYVHQRESEFAKGVSTYKADYDRLEPVGKVIAQHEAFLRQQNIKPEQLVANLMTADQTLRFGNAQDKLRLFAKLATDYQIPLHEMLEQRDDGKVYLNQQYFQPQAQAPQPSGLTKEDAEKLFQEKLSNMQWANAIQSFASAKDDKGQPKYPHFEMVRQDMDGLLRLGKAKDLESAYKMACRLHDDIWESEMAAKTAAAQSTTQKVQQAQVGKAKATAVSPRTATPSADTGTGKAKGIRASVEAAIDAHAASGRV